jgi:translation elongation factor EF-Tu-like GTPase
MDEIKTLKKYIIDNNLREYRDRIKPDIEAEVYFFTSEHGGRSTPALTGYRPSHLVKENYLTTGCHVYIDQDFVFPGHTARTLIAFISPEAYPHCLTLGKRINIQEGGRIVGHATVTKIYNKLLESKR